MLAKGRSVNAMERLLWNFVSQATSSLILVPRSAASQRDFSVQCPRRSCQNRHGKLTTPTPVLWCSHGGTTTSLYARDAALEGRCGRAVRAHPAPATGRLVVPPTHARRAAGHAGLSWLAR